MRDAKVESESVFSWITVSNNFMMSSAFSARILFYPTLLWNVVMESSSRRWYDRIDSTLILGALPFKSQTKQLVEEEKVKAVVTLNEEYETKYFSNSAEEWSAWGVTQLRLETVDFNNAPPQEMLKKGVEFLEDMTSKGNTVYVHCKAGRGRSTTLVACYLMKKMSMTPMQAHSYIQAKRPHIRLGSRQWEAIHEYYQQLTGSKSL
ncbi:phosphatidylglycerophosphatase and protein-tyrosine phosphatase 1-like [Actinia tenebrosa]|uniref:Phosphatidylglycerophosphatase and protein-tyrosine phosphatase 1 n=1 Tax=Actinia tenebrosa TaxID=6105 RepID=A0A6P8HWM9_ACTTE|nr:phosphatidylglycerophosphatase and protein-tyrosine phosphatase 1-like [Actinia tenebrosa]